MPWNFGNVCDLYEYDMFEEIELPDGINKEILVNTIMDKCFWYEPVYNEHDFLKQKVEVFFLRNYRNYEKLVYLYSIEYDPQYNYNRMYTETTLNDNIINTDTGVSEKTTEDTTYADDKTVTDTLSGSDVETLDDDTTLKHTGTKTTENEVSAYNSSSYQEDNYQTITYNETQTGTDDATTTTKYGKVDTEVTDDDATTNIIGTLTSTTDEDRVEDLEENVSGHAYGNIGVTTTQKLLNEEIDLWTKFNIYELIANDFFDEFMCHVVTF